MMVFLISDAVLMAGLFYLLITARRTGGRGEGGGDDSDKALHESLADLAARLESELKSVRKTAARMESKRLDFERYESLLNEKHRRLNKKVREAESAARRMEIICRTAGGENIYADARRIMSMGVPAEEVARRFNLLEGEAELVASLSALKN